MEDTAADFEFFLEFRVCGFLDVWVSVSVFVPRGVLVHGFFEGPGDSNVIYNESTFFGFSVTTEDTVYAGDGLH